MVSNGLLCLFMTNNRKQKQVIAMFEQLKEDIDLLIQDFEAADLSKDDFLEQLKDRLNEYQEDQKN